MKLDRLLSIIILLINRRRVQAKELADLFEVSIRTIYRDIETINQAGIPIITYQGANGGIGLTEGYRFDRNLLTNDDLVAITTALRSLSTTHRSVSNQVLMEKINSIVPEGQRDEFQSRTNKLIVDFSSWGYRRKLELKVEELNQAIDNLRIVTFTYNNAEGSISERRVEPYTLVLKRHQWYLYAFCLARAEFRLFKLMRMKNVSVDSQMFSRKEISLLTLPWNQAEQQPLNGIKLVLELRSSIKHLAEEWFDVEELTKNTNGSYTATVHYPENDWLYGFILGFGPNVEVIEPPHIRAIIRQLAIDTAHKYE